MRMTVQKSCNITDLGRMDLIQSCDVGMHFGKLNVNFIKIGNYRNFRTPPGKHRVHSNDDRKRNAQAFSGRHGMLIISDLVRS